MKRGAFSKSVAESPVNEGPPDFIRNWSVYSCPDGSYAIVTDVFVPPLGASHSEIDSSVHCLRKDSVDCGEVVSCIFNRLAQDSELKNLDQDKLIKAFQKIHWFPPGV